MNKGGKVQRKIKCSSKLPCLHILYHYIFELLTTRFNYYFPVYTASTVSCCHFKIIPPITDPALVCFFVDQDQISDGRVLQTCLFLSVHCVHCILLPSYLPLLTPHLLSVKAVSYCFSVALSQKQDWVDRGATHARGRINTIKLDDSLQFSLDQSGPIEKSVRVFVCLFVWLFVRPVTFEVPFNGLFAPTSHSRMSKNFRDL